MKNITRILLYLLIVSQLLIGCEKKDNPESLNNKQFVEKTILANEGGTIITSDSIKLLIPANALPSDGIVSIGRTGNEPTSVPNEYLHILDNPVTLQIPSDTIYKSIQVSFPISSNVINSENSIIVLFDGDSYFPMNFSINNEIVTVDIDLINWQSNFNKKSTLLSKLIILYLNNEQVPPEYELGIKEISIQSDQFQYYTPSANSSSKIILFVHGWMGRTTTWDNMLLWFQEELDLDYTNFWTFGYNSSYSINHNAGILASQIKSYANGAHIDVVAHSMGGLVSRSTIEKYGGDKYISQLFTLGSPHHGSPLAAIRYALGIIVAADDASDYINFDYNTQGFKDLYTRSDYISEMMRLNNPPIPYHLIAAICTPQWNFFIKGEDDGIVGVSSALGITEAETPNSPFVMPYKEAHRKMTRYKPIYDYILNTLKESESPSQDGFMTDSRDGHTYKTVNIGNQTWMAENLAYLPSVSPSSNGSRSTPYYYVYDYEGTDVTEAKSTNNYKTYGALYNFATAQEVCPSGWHLPSDGEWNELADYLGGADIAGSKMKEVGTSHWDSPNSDATNESGFTGLPGGGRHYNGYFDAMYISGDWWSTLEQSSGYVWGRHLQNASEKLLRGYGDKERAWSIRCLKD